MTQVRLVELQMQSLLQTQVSYLTAGLIVSFVAEANNTGSTTVSVGNTTVYTLCTEKMVQHWRQETFHQVTQFILLCTGSGNRAYLLNRYTEEAFTGEGIQRKETAVASDGALTMVGAVEKDGVPVYDNTADYTTSVDFKGSVYFESGGTKYVIGFSNNRNMYVSKNGGAFTTVTDALQSANNDVEGATVSISGSTISLFILQATTTNAYVYTYNTSNDTLSFVATRALGSFVTAGLSAAFVRNGSELTVWLQGVQQNNIRVYDTDATFSTLTYQSSKSFTNSLGSVNAMEQVIDKVYLISNSGGTAKAYNLDRTVDTSFDFTLSDENTRNDTMYADDTHIYIHDKDDNKFYAYKYKIPTLVKINTPQDCTPQTNNKNKVSKLHTHIR